VVPHGVKEATDNESQIRKWWSIDPHFNPGITGGVIVDADTGLNSLEDAISFAEANQFPSTLLVRTGRRPEFGAQFHFTGEAVNGLYTARGVSGEIRSRNEYGMGPGSVHPSGTLYEVAADFPRAIAPPDLLRAFRKKAPSSKEPKPGFKVGEGERFYWLRSQCGRLVNAGLTGDALFAALQSLNETFCNPPKPKDDVRTLADAATEKFTANVEPPQPAQEDSGQAALLRVLDWIVKGFLPRRPAEETYADLAAISREEYEDVRETVANALGIRVSALDEFVNKRRPAKAGGEESQVDFKPSVSWTHAVDGLALLRDTAAAVRRFIVFKNPQDAEVVATWVLGTYLHNEFGIFPRLGVTSTFPESGKTTLMDFLEYSCLRSVRGDNVSVSVFFRVIDEHHPCLLLDECDTFLVKNPELIGVLNSGHKKGGYVWRTEEINGKFVAVRFGTYAPVAYGMIGHPTATFFSRSIFIRLDRKTANQTVEDFDPEENLEQMELMENLRRRMVRWADDHRAEVKECRPDTGKLSNRARNNWRALLKIGQVAGGDWNSILMTAAGCPSPLTRKTTQEKLLKDIRNIFHTRSVDRLPSEVLVADLLAQKQSGWSRYHEGRTELDESDLADLLTDFGVEPQTHHFPKEVQLSLWQKAKDRPLKLRGYLLEQFAGLIATYLKGAAEEVPVGSLHAPF